MTPYLTSDICRLTSGLLAETMDRFTPGAIGWTVLGIIAALASVALILTVLTLGRNFFARRPPIDDDLQRYSTTIEKMKLDLGKLAPNEKIEALVERLGNFATVTQIAALEVSLEQQVKDQRAYTHTEVHKVRGELNAFSMESHMRSERLAALEADSKTLTQQLRDLNIKADKIVERVGDKIEQLIRDGIIRRGAIR